MQTIERTAGDLFDRAQAIYTADERHRLVLRQRWADGPLLNFLMLNPSTATEIKNDPTVERCQRRARSGGFGGLIVTNLFSLRSTDPRGLVGVADPSAPANDRFILSSAKAAGLVVCAWGSHAPLKKLLPPRATSIVESLRLAGVTLHALRINADGQPAHPLYLPYELQPVEWKP